MPSPLNIFQLTQRRWDAIHPYNAAQAMRVAGIPNLGKIQDTFNQSLADLGLGEFVIHGNCYSVSKVSQTVLVRDYGNETLESVLSAEMNQPFNALRSIPFRPFVMRENASYYLGLVYQHWVADSVSIRLLTRQWFLHLFQPERAAIAPVQWPVAGMKHYAGQGWSRVRELIRLVDFSKSMKTCRRLYGVDASAMQVGTLIKRLPEGLIDQIRERAKSDGASVGDVFVAAGAMACARSTACAISDKRPNLAFGTIADVRHRNPAIPANLFGLFLGFTTSLFLPEQLTQLTTLLKAASVQSSQHRQTKAAEASQLRMGIGYRLAGRWSSRDLLEFYRKRLPLVGGLSNVNLNTDWPREFYPAPLLEYLRVSPTGPMMPLVFTPTTLGKTLHTCFTYRTSALTEEKARELVAVFVQCLKKYGQGEADV